MTFTLSHLAPQFIQEMVQAMYAYEARMPLDPNLLNDAEMRDFYTAYMGAPTTHREEPVTTHQPDNPDLLNQDLDKGLSKALANAPHARLDAKEAAMAILEARLRRLGYTPDELDRDNPYNQWMEPTRGRDPLPESADECEFGQDEYQWRLRQEGL